MVSLDKLKKTAYENMHFSRSCEFFEDRWNIRSYCTLATLYGLIIHLEYMHLSQYIEPITLYLNDVDFTCLPFTLFYCYDIITEHFACSRNCYTEGGITRPSGTRNTVIGNVKIFLKICDSLLVFAGKHQWPWYVSTIALNNIYIWLLPKNLLDQNKLSSNIQIFIAVCRCRR